MGTRIDVLQLGDVVFSAAPELVSRQRHWVCNAEVVERAEKFFFERFRQTNFSGETVAEIRSHAGAVHALWRRRQSQKNSRTESLEYRTIAGGRTVMHFIHDDAVVELTPDLFPQAP